MKVNVLMTAYNHEKFIAKAIESVLMQKTNFDFKLIIGEDFSADRTKEIILEYAGKYPEKITAIIREKNYGLMPNFIDLLKICNTSEYTAWLEGDDYWTDPLKLQKQVDFLDSYPDFSLSSHNVNIVMDGKIVKEYCPKDHPKIMDLKYLLTYGSGGPTCSLVIRNKTIKNLPEWFWRVRGGDWGLQVVAAQTGKMNYFNEVMGAYRRHGQGALYTEKRVAQSEGRSDFSLPSKHSLEMIGIVDKYFEYKYSQQLDIHKTYWYYLYIKDYLAIGDIKTARHYFYRILKQSYKLKFWKSSWISAKLFIKLSSLLFLPEVVIKKHLTSHGVQDKSTN